MTIEQNYPKAARAAAKQVFEINYRTNILNQGKYKPYFEDNPEDLIGVVRYSMEKCPAWCRRPRVVRDIPINYIECGNTHANLRQMIDDQLDKEGIVSMDIRSREIGRHSQYYKKPAFYVGVLFYRLGIQKFFSSR